MFSFCSLKDLQYMSGTAGVTLNSRSWVPEFASVNWQQHCSLSPIEQIADKPNCWCDRKKQFHIPVRPYHRGLSDAGWLQKPSIRQTSGASKADQTHSASLSTLSLLAISMSFTQTILTFPISFVQIKHCLFPSPHLHVTYKTVNTQILDSTIKHCFSRNFIAYIIPWPTVGLKEWKRHNDVLM